MSQVKQVASVRPHPSELSDRPIRRRFFAIDIGISSTVVYRQISILASWHSPCTALRIYSTFRQTWKGS
jgi:hypothetical protein